MFFSYIYILNFKLNVNDKEFRKYLIVVSLFDLLMDCSLLALINTLNACWTNLFILFQQWYTLLELDIFCALVGLVYTILDRNEIK